MSTETRSWDMVEHLKTKKDMAAYLDSALEDNDRSVVVAAVDDIAQAEAMTQLPRDTDPGFRSSME